MTEQTCECSKKRAPDTRAACGPTCPCASRRGRDSPPSTRADPSHVRGPAAGERGYQFHSILVRGAPNYEIKN